MTTIKGIGHRRVLNSHVEFTTEFFLELVDGRHGAAASPRGETISIYEAQGSRSSPECIVAKLRTDGYIGRPISQAQLDEYLAARIPQFGRDCCCAISLAFFQACRSHPAPVHLDRAEARWTMPRICCNVLNGGRHAYTNPVLSDFPEYLLVARTADVELVVEAHNEIQQLVKEQLKTLAWRTVGDNAVRCFGTPDNRECFDLLFRVLDRSGWSGQFDLMVDASAGQLWTDQGYRFEITDNSLFSPDQMVAYWLRLGRDYDVRFLEDPLRESEVDTWRQLTASVPAGRCQVIGDNFYSSDEARIERGAAERCTHGVVIKPNQAGTVSACCRALERARAHGQTIITSHRSISTEENFLATLSCCYGVDYSKIGPLHTDYSSVLRLNEMVRLAGQPKCHQPRSSALSVTPVPITMPSDATPVLSISP